MESIFSLLLIILQLVIRPLDLSEIYAKSGNGAWLQIFECYEASPSAAACDLDVVDPRAGLASRTTAVRRN
jgi:hypothetical protein